MARRAKRVRTRLFEYLHSPLLARASLRLEAIPAWQQLRARHSARRIMHKRRSRKQSGLPKPITRSCQIAAQPLPSYDSVRSGPARDTTPALDPFRLAASDRDLS